MRSRKDVQKTRLERQTSKVLRQEDFMHNRSPGAEHGVLNEYVRVESEDAVVGRGSQSSSVRLYRSTKDNRLYAIKAFHQVRQGSKRPGAKDGLSLRPTHSEREEVLREADIMRRLEHPNIVRIEELIDDCYGDTHTTTENDAMYLVMEYVEGCSLQSLLENSAPISESLLHRCVCDTISGLSYLHSQNIIHMDIKPANLILTSDHSTVKLCDFGTSTLSSSVDNAKRGTTLFRAPELLKKGNGFPQSFEAGMAADVWSMGASIYYMATASRVHQQPEEVFQALNLDPVQLDAATMGLSPGFCDLLSLVLEHDAEKRITLPQTVEHPWVVYAPEEPRASLSGSISASASEAESL